MKRLAAILAAIGLTISAAAAVDLPPAGTQYDSQLGGAYTPPGGTKIVSRDRTAAAAPGLYNICYVNAFQTQAVETDWWLSNHPDLLLAGANGRPLEDPTWPGEFLLDTSTAEKRAALAAIVEVWFEGCKRSGFQAVEADNLDTYSRSGGRLTMRDNLAYATLLADIAVRNGLALAQKNAAELLGSAKRAGFSFAIVESCEVYDECEDYTSVYGNHVIEIEYTDTDRAYFDRACRERGGKISIVLRDRGLQPASRSQYAYEAC